MHVDFQETDHIKMKKAAIEGAFKTLCWVLIKVLAWALMSVCAAALSIACFTGAIVLWARGLYGVYRWVCWRSSEEGKSVSGETPDYRCPTAMPGQEQGAHWKHAWTIAKGGNRKIRDNRDSAHFNVGPLLTNSTGLNVGQLALLIRTRHEISNRKEELHEVDRNVAGVHLFPPRAGTSDKVYGSIMCIPSGRHTTGLY